MNAERIVFDAAAGGGNRIVAFICPATTGDIKGVFQICHGMTDHFGRYEEMTDYLNSKGWHVCGLDMLGHGETWKTNIGNNMPKGFFGAGKDSAECILRDEMELHRIVKERFGDGLDYVLYGHSMGSFIVRNMYIDRKYSDEFDRFIFASTMGPNPGVGAGLALSRITNLFGQRRKPGKLINSIAFKPYNKRIDHPKTSFDWLSTDDEEIRKYIEDEMAGFLFTSKGFTDLFTLISRMQSSKAYRDLPDKPAFMPYGEEDPVGGYGKGVRKVEERLRAAGADITVKDYGHYRHELQHEPVRYEYFDDIDRFASGQEITVTQGENNGI